MKPRPPFKLLELLPEQIYRAKDTVPIAVVDLRVALFRILYKAKHEVKEGLLDEGDTASERFVNWAKCNWTILFNRPISWLRHEPKYWQTLVVDDCTDNQHKYWRSKIYAEYKGNREYTERPTMYKELLDIAYAMIAKQEFPLFRQEGFEADDFAGAIFRLKPSFPERQVYLCTSDSDWLQLVDDGLNIAWANALVHKPRLRREAQVYAYWKKKHNWQLTSISAIADHKQQFGDSSDNIAPGAPRDVICLRQPSHKPEASAMLDFCSSRVPNTSKERIAGAVQWLHGQSFSINYY